MLREALPCNFFPAGAGFAVIAVRIDGDASAGGEFAPYFDVLGIHQFDQILHDLIDAILVEVTVIAERIQVKLERLAFYHALRGHIGDVDGRKVRLTGDRTERGEFGAVEFYEIVVVRMLVFEGFKHFGRIVAFISCCFVSKQGETFAFAIFHKLHLLCLSIDIECSDERFYENGTENTGNDLSDKQREDHCKIGDAE